MGQGAEYRQTPMRPRRLEFLGQYTGEVKTAKSKILGRCRKATSAFSRVIISARMSGNQPGQEPRGEIRDSIIQTVYSSVIKSQTENLPKSWEIGHTALSIPRQREK